MHPDKIAREIRDALLRDPAIAEAVAGRIYGPPTAEEMELAWQSALRIFEEEGEDVPALLDRAGRVLECWSEHPYQGPIPCPFPEDEV